MNSVKTPSLNATKEKTASVLAETVAELTRRAIKPELQPFESTLNTLGGKLEEHVLLIQAQCKAHENALDSAQRRLTNAVDDFQLDNIRLNGLIDGFQDDEQRVATKALSRLEQVLLEWEATLSLLRSEEERSAMRASVQALCESIQSSFDTIGTELDAKINEINIQNTERTELVLSLAQRIDATKNELAATTAALEASNLAIEAMAEKIHGSNSQIHDRLQSAEQSLEQLTSVLAKTTSTLNGIITSIQEQSVTHESTLEHLKADETRLVKIDQATNYLDQTKNELVVLRGALSFQRKALFGVIILAIISILSSVASIFF